jgi:hypothetical protein
MSDIRITVNGQHYGSPDEMPPDVRRQYEEAMRLIGPALAGKGSGTTQVVTHSHGGGLQGNIVINKTVTVNNRTFDGVEKMPADLRQFFEGGLQATQASGRTYLDFNPSQPTPLPIQPSNAPSEGRRFVYDIAFWVLVALALWLWLGRY